MKNIWPLVGAAAFREAVEEYQPLTGVFQHDLIELVRNTYQFQTYPILTPGAPPPPILAFGGGRFTGASGETFTIGQLNMTQDGDVVLATTTEQADIVLDDLMRILDEQLGFRLREAEKTKSYVSNVVVEFDRGLESYMNAFATIAETVNAARPGREPFNIKRIGFGVREVTQPSDPLTMIEKAEFLIERRAGHPFEENRYFCSAPLPNADHIRVLERIEMIMRGEGA